MIKRRKDGGFTLIELMIVIAVIGILAVVLVPKMSSIKSSAKVTGVTTNAKSVEAFIVSNIDKWSRAEDPAQAAKDALENQFIDDDAVDMLTNPFTGESGADALIAGDAPEESEGVVAVTLPEDLTGGITIKGYGNGTDPEKVYEQTIKAD